MGKVFLEAWPQSPLKLAPAALAIHTESVESFQDPLSGISESTPENMQEVSRGANGIIVF